MKSTYDHMPYVLYVLYVNDNKGLPLYVAPPRRVYISMFFLHTMDAKNPRGSLGKCVATVFNGKGIRHVRTRNRGACADGYQF